jgi:hypothetical protein
MRGYATLCIALVLIVMKINDVYGVVSTCLETLQQWQMNE